jgi:hypothetical protein
MTFSGLLVRGVPPLPPFLRILKIAIIVLALIVLALAAYSISVFSGYFDAYGDSGVAGLLIFVVIKTWIIFGISLIVELRAPQFFFRVIFLFAYIVSIIFWLSAWAWSASVAATWLSWESDFCGDGEDCEGIDAPFAKEGGALAGAAGIGAIVWVLCIAHVFLYIRACLRDPDGTAAAGVTHQQVEFGQVKAQEAQGGPAAYPPQAYPPQAYQEGYPQQQQPYQQVPQPYPSQ